MICSNALRRKIRRRDLRKKMSVIYHDIVFSFNPRLLRLKDFNLKDIDDALRYLSPKWFKDNIPCYDSLYADKKPKSGRQFLIRLIRHHQGY